MKKIILVITVLISFLYGLLVGKFNIFPYEYINYVYHNISNSNTSLLLNNNNENIIKTYEMYENNSLPKIVMIGDSITRNSLSWNELLKRNDIINRGIGGDTTARVLKRLNSINPKSINKAFIMLGINDISTYVKIPQIMSNYKKIINFLIKNNIEPIIQSTLFTNKKNKRYMEYNEKVFELNKYLKKYADSESIKFIDLNKKLSKNNELIDNYTIDGVHLNYKGYIVWRDILWNYLDAYTS